MSFLTALTKSAFSAVVRLITFFRTSTGGGTAWEPLVVALPLDPEAIVVGGAAEEAAGLLMATAEPACEPAEVHAAAASRTATASRPIVDRWAIERPWCDVMHAPFGQAAEGLPDQDMLERE